ncbi:hypothetical protein [Halomonas cerina]|uniref:Uncharacterized protein n=1 Tax=Halomonas cerina TaxID=447424 RepID=A0A839VAX1_9GAMM|nr:hypothetical protein [Halomonas cerina]MBB3191120.1 hypothetical protein [Halomonas cerina]
MIPTRHIHAPADAAAFGAMRRGRVMASHYYGIGYWFRPGVPAAMS